MTAAKRGRPASGRVSRCYRIFEESAEKVDTAARLRGITPAQVLEELIAAMPAPADAACTTEDRFDSYRTGLLKVRRYMAMYYYIIAAVVENNGSVKTPKFRAGLDEIKQNYNTLNARQYGHAVQQCSDLVKITSEKYRAAAALYRVTSISEAMLKYVAAACTDAEKQINEMSDAQLDQTIKSLRAEISNVAGWEKTVESAVAAAAVEVPVQAPVKVQEPTTVAVPAPVPVKVDVDAEEDAEIMARLNAIADAPVAPPVKSKIVIDRRVTADFDEYAQVVND